MGEHAREREPRIDSVTLPAIVLSSASTAETDGDVLVLGLVKRKDGPAIVGGDAFDWLEHAVRALGATGATDEFTRVPRPEGGSVALIGIGSGEIDAKVWHERTP